jgi:hypothetical protein
MPIGDIITGQEVSVLPVFRVDVGVAAVGVLLNDGGPMSEGFPDVDFAAVWPPLVHLVTKQSESWLEAFPDGALIDG